MMRRRRKGIVTWPNEIATSQNEIATSQNEPWILRCCAMDPGLKGQPWPLSFFKRLAGWLGCGLTDLQPGAAAPRVCWDFGIRAESAWAVPCCPPSGCFFADLARIPAHHAAAASDRHPPPGDLPA
jgi:hypothetical protein